MPSQNREQKAWKLTFQRRLKNVKKKAEELSALCGTTACFLCYGPNGQVHTWPENSNEVKSRLLEFKRQYVSSENDDGDDNSNSDLAKGIERLEKRTNGLRQEILRKIMKLAKLNLDYLGLTLELMEDSNEEDQQKEDPEPTAAHALLSLMGGDDSG